MQEEIKKGEATAEPTVVTPKTVGEIAEEASPSKGEDSPRETVGLDKFLDLKKQNKDLKRSYEDLRKSIEEGATKNEVAADIDSIADEYPDVDKGFLTKLANSIKDSVKKDANDEITSRLRPLEQKEKDEKIHKAFTKHFDSAMDEMPEFKNIVNADVIKTLSFEPKNKNKTFKDIIEETYSGALTGKRTIETTVPGGGKDTEPLDFSKARKDSGYFDQVMSNPRLKAEYNEKMLKEGF